MSITSRSIWSSVRIRSGPSMPSRRTLRIWRHEESTKQSSRTISPRPPLAETLAVSNMPARVEQEIAESCNGLVKNSIVCGNCLYMARRLEAVGSLEQGKGFSKLLSRLTQPGHWGGIKLLGKHDTFQREATGQYWRTTPIIGSRDRPLESRAVRCNASTALPMLPSRTAVREVSGCSSLSCGVIAFRVQT